MMFTKSYGTFNSDELLLEKHDKLKIKLRDLKENLENSEEAFQLNEKQMSNKNSDPDRHEFLNKRESFFKEKNKKISANIETLKKELQLISAEITQLEKNRFLAAALARQESSCRATA